ncbi:hypothetical protein AMAG_19124 [Allomyces macrogynus ATCC 38327]|uniref:ABC transmembrane type-1 domain-containing protein n=1 Tax=Allomyces macrogynus (strain ATCC 38327) TaxID=578462 RepID=A0A0L0SNR3_ALLM3|nr:hypothetical protein AMAG_19124 [Allomyces macrogynus ATCC 38327]|eukprot:KNE64153.1 hypothetical protein AMAG_19124 [Allomyces macrogynus ATCC 38327]
MGDGCREMVDTDVVLLDDVLSAVDAPTAAHLFQQCILGELSGRTRVLVTHNVGLVAPWADHILYVKEGRIVAEADSIGTAAAQLAHAGLYAEAEMLSEVATPVSLSRANSVTTLDAAGRRRSMTAGFKGKGKAKAKVTKFIEQIMGSSSSSSSSSSPSSSDAEDSDSDEADADKPVKEHKLISDEEKAQGSVEWKVYATYIAAAGGAIWWAVLLSTLFIPQFLNVAQDWWLKTWAQAYTRTGVYVTYALPSAITTAFAMDPSTSDVDVDYYLLVYLGLSTLNIAVQWFQNMLEMSRSMAASTKLHDCILGELSGRTRVLVTHNVGLVAPWADHILYVKEGRIVAEADSIGTAAAQLAHAGLYAEAEMLSEVATPVSLSRANSVTTLDAAGRRRSMTAGFKGKGKAKAKVTKFIEQIMGSSSSSSSSSSPSSSDAEDSDSDEADADKPVKEHKLISDEEKAQGSVEWKVYATYIAAAGGAIWWAVLLSTLFIPQFLNVAQDWWLKTWAQAYTRTGVYVTYALPSAITTAFAMDPSTSDVDVDYYLLVYLGLSTLNIAKGDDYGHDSYDSYGGYGHDDKKDSYGYDSYDSYGYGHDKKDDYDSYDSYDSYGYGHDKKDDYDSYDSYDSYGYGYDKKDDYDSYNSYDSYGYGHDDKKDDYYGHDSYDSYGYGYDGKDDYYGHDSYDSYGYGYDGKDDYYGHDSYDSYGYGYDNKDDYDSYDSYDSYGYGHDDKKDDYYGHDSYDSYGYGHDDKDDYYGHDSYDSYGYGYDKKDDYTRH